MPLIKCDECGRKISDQSRFCPRCGHPTHLNKAYQEIHSEDTPQPQVTEISELSQQTVETPEEVATQLEKVREDNDIAVNIDDLDRAAILAETRRKNDRVKTWIFIIVTAAVLGLIIAVYCLTPKDTGVKEEVMEDVAEETMTDIQTTDTIPEPLPAAATDSKAVTPVVDKPTPKPTSAEAVAEPTTTTPAEPHEVTVAPLSEQVAPAHNETPTSATPTPTE